MACAVQFTLNIFCYIEEGEAYNATLHYNNCQIYVTM